MERKGGQMSERRWLPIPGASRYSVSDDGRVRNTTTGKELKASLGQGYPTVGLPTGTIRVHILVAAAFIGPRPVGMSIDHVDGNKTNNDVSNLEYVTHEENMRRAAVLGLLAKGEDNGASKLTSADVADARSLARQGHTHRQIAARLDVARSTVTCAVSGTSWGWADGAIPRGTYRRGWTLLGAIREASAAGKSQREIARETGVSQRTVGRIIRGESWAAAKGAKP